MSESKWSGGSGGRAVTKVISKRKSGLGVQLKKLEEFK